MLKPRAHVAPRGDEVACPNSFMGCGYTRHPVGYKNEPEITQDKLMVTSDENVGGFNVTMDNAFLREERDRAYDRPERAES